jgi:hypothetical protein
MMHHSHHHARRATMVGFSTQSAGGTQGAAANPRHWFDFRAPIVPYEMAEGKAGSR